MDVKLEKAIESDANTIFDIQVDAFQPLLKKYKDFDTNPANETIERVVTRINNPTGDFYKISVDNAPVGAIYVLWKEQTQFWISPMFILSAYQGQGIAQQALTLVEKLFPHATTWELATILEEERNCHLYEKLGYIKTGIITKVNDNTTLGFYKKTCNP